MTIDDTELETVATAEGVAEEGIPSIPSRSDFLYENGIEFALWKYGGGDNPPVPDEVIKRFEALGISSGADRYWAECERGLIYAWDIMYDYLAVHPYGRAALRAIVADHAHNEFARFIVERFVQQFQLVFECLPDGDRFPKSIIDWKRPDNLFALATAASMRRLSVIARLMYISRDAYDEKSFTEIALKELRSLNYYRSEQGVRELMVELGRLTLNADRRGILTVMKELAFSDIDRHHQKWAAQYPELAAELILPEE